tara:strand:+ start:17753 stop:17977 length:225 start_codon:yes stop_codon:yes gene_type:complete
MEKITEIATTLDTDFNAFEIIVKCKRIAEHLDLTNIIIDNQCYEEKEMLIDLIEMIKSLEIDIIDNPIRPEAEA